jgi:hypothetical protein
MSSNGEITAEIVVKEPAVLARRASSLYSQHEKSGVKRFIKRVAKGLIERIPFGVKDTIAQVVRTHVEKLYKVLIGGAIDRLCRAFEKLDFVSNPAVQAAVEDLVGAVLDAAIGALTEAIHGRL